MRIKKHLVAATLAVGLAGSAAAMAPSGNPMKAQAGFAVAYYALNNNPAAQAFGQGSMATAGGLAGAYVGKKVGTRAAAWMGARIGASLGAAFGPGGAILGAGLGAL